MPLPKSKPKKEKPRLFFSSAITICVSLTNVVHEQVGHPSMWATPKC